MTSSWRVRACLRLLHLAQLTSLMVYERSRRYSNAATASENGHGPGTLYYSKMVYTGNGLTRTRALYHRTSRLNFSVLPELREAR